MTMPHSPTPWRLDAANWCITREPTGRALLIFHPGYKQEDMEFILRAVNCHDELVAAMRAILPRLARAEALAGLPLELPFEAAAVLAKAEG